MMKNIKFKDVVTLLVFAIGSLVLFCTPIVVGVELQKAFKTPKDYETFQVSKVLLKADWNDEHGKPAYQIVQDTQGEVILRIHGSADGWVWGFKDETCPLNKFLDGLNIKVTKVLCCFPMRVRVCSNVPQKFFYPEHGEPLWASRSMEIGDEVKVWNKNPNKKKNN